MLGLFDPRFAATRHVRQSCLRAALILLVVLSCPLVSARAQTPSSDGPTINAKLLDSMRKRGDLTLRNTTLDGALFTISELWNINIVVGNDVQGQVNGVFKKAPLSEILNAILLANGFSYRPVGDSLVIMRLDELGQVNPLFESATIPVQQGNAQEIADSARLMSSPQGQIQAIASANMIFVLDFPDRVAMIREFVANIDANSKPTVTGETPETQPMAIAYFAPDYVDPVSVKGAIEVVLSKDGKAAVMENDRKIVVVDHPSNLAQARAVFEQVDVPRQQVRIHALVYDISLDDIEQLGFNWHHTVQGRYNAEDEPQTVFDIDSVMSIPFTAGTNGATMTFANLSRAFDISAVVLALQSANDARLLANPNVTVEDNEEAIFESIAEIPYQQLTQTTEGGQIGTTAFRNAGIKLRVRPRIARDGTIQLHVEPEFSRLSGFTPEDNQPIIDTRRATTTVRIANRQTLVIGGLRQRSDTGNFRGVPGFKDVRYLGNLFRSRETNVRESELLVFIMPELIGYDDPPKPRQMAAAETNLCRLNQIPVAEGCSPYDQRVGCQGSTGPGQCVDSTILPIPMTIPDVRLDDGPSSRQDVTGAYPNTNLRIVQLPLVDSSRTPAAPKPFSPLVVQTPEKTSYRLRTAFDNRYRSTGGVYKNQQRLEEPAATEQRLQEETEPEKAKKHWWERVLRL